MFLRRLAALLLTTGLLGAPWFWPLPAPHQVVRPYLAPATPYAAGHRGVDLAAADGDEVRAPDDGVVHFAGVIADRPVLSIEHTSGVLTSFEPLESSLVEGDAVRRGQVIGVVRPGHCREPCLHFGARIAGEYVSPLIFLSGQPRAVLLPTRGGGRDASQ